MNRYTRDRGFTIWLTGPPGAGKSTLAHLVAERLRLSMPSVEVLDGDIIRKELSKDLGYGREDRIENVRRIAFMARLLARNGVAVVVAAVSPHRCARQEARSSIPQFLEVHVHCPLPVLLLRDPKGLYQRALSGDISNFTGVSDVYEPPINPEVALDTSAEDPATSAARIWRVLKDRGWVTAGD